MTIVKKIGNVTFKLKIKFSMTDLDFLSKQQNLDFPVTNLYEISYNMSSTYAILVQIYLFVKTGVYPERS